MRHAYFLGANDPYKALKTTLKAEINPGSMGDAPQRYFPTLQQAGVRPHRREGDQSLGGRGDEGVQGGLRNRHSNPSSVTKNLAAP